MDYGFPIVWFRVVCCSWQHRETNVVTRNVKPYVSEVFDWTCVLDGAKIHRLHKNNVSATGPSTSSALRRRIPFKTSFEWKIGNREFVYFRKDCLQLSPRNIFTRNGAKPKSHGIVSASVRLTCAGLAPYEFKQSKSPHSYSIVVRATLSFFEQINFEMRWFFSCDLVCCVCYSNALKTRFCQGTCPCCTDV